MALADRKIAVTVNSRQHQGISVPKHKIIRTVFVAKYGSDVFCSEYTNEKSPLLVAMDFFHLAGQFYGGFEGTEVNDSPGDCQSRADRGA